MIDSKAIIDPSALIGEDVHIGPYSIIGPNVTIGDGTHIGPHVVIKGPTKIGKHNRIYQFASIGEDPQDKKFQGEDNSHLVIGDHNTIREFVTISRGTAQDQGLTKIGHHNWLMAYVHIAHDCMVGNYVTFSNNASLAGHVIVEDHANLAGFSGVHQFCRIGRYAFCAGGAIVVKDVPPFVMAAGYPATLHGLNTIGLKRAGFTDDEQSALKKAYKIMFRQGLTVDEAVAKIQAEAFTAQLVEQFSAFIRTSERGVIR